MKLISLNWTNFELFYVLESIRNIVQDSTRFEKIQEYSKSKSTSQSQKVKGQRSTCLVVMLSCNELSNLTFQR